MTTDGTVDPVRSTSIDGVYVLLPTPVVDDRGWFSRTLDLAWCESVGCTSRFVHHNQSRSRRGVLRGLHVRAGIGETKMVRCARGGVVDFVVDTRPWSPTFRAVERFDLDDERMLHLLIPPFVAHGYQVVSGEADVCYLHSRPYEPGADLAIAWDDPCFDLDWPVHPPILSERDATAPRLDELDLWLLFDREPSAPLDRPVS